ncbi:cytochrome P450 [Herbihabitans rhizosphaerae]|uniref:Cytochrome P450 n=1 Tax=Herbihabitans rhizosphaerae TaxID=1872711 RepID=A0A4Q7KJY9_9PSEU|nr:cytochrome P450 [Herbihabitans rhizosphaerae]RZS36516.1 cytochrome P450 [Herbihabitans rhizosphaerae]
MGTLKSRVISWIARRYMARKGGSGGLDLSSIGMLPDKVLVPLRRDGLDPIPELYKAGEPIRRLPLRFGLKAWLVTGHAEAKQILGAKHVSTDFANLVGQGASTDSNPGGLGMADPPVHTRLRKLLTPEFTMRRLNRLTPRIHDIIEGQLDAMAKVDGPVDLVQEFALPIPSLVICELLGVPYDDRDDFQRLAMARFDLYGGAGASLGAISESLDYLLGVVEQQRKDPGDGLLGMIIKEHGDETSDLELAGLADGVLTGGFETTASMLALGAVVLLSDPEAMRLVRDDDEAIGPFVEELLRYLTVVQVAFPRFVKQDMEIGGVTLSEGDVVIVSLSGADRDEALGENMNSVEPTRKPTSHLAFGYGIHRCIGAELAKMELRAAYPALVRRFPSMRLHVPASELAYRQTSIVYAVDTLPVVLS